MCGYVYEEPSLIVSKLFINSVKKYHPVNHLNPFKPDLINRSISPSFPLPCQIRRQRERIKKELEEAAEEQNPAGLLPPKSEDDDESAGASSTYGYTVTIPSKGMAIGV